jgi:hypothetical protein
VVAVCYYRLLHAQKCAKTRLSINCNNLNERRVANLERLLGGGSLQVGLQARRGRVNQRKVSDVRMFGCSGVRIFGFADLRNAGVSLVRVFRVLGVRIFVCSDSDFRMFGCSVNSTSSTLDQKECPVLARFCAFPSQTTKWYSFNLVVP